MKTEFITPGSLTWNRVLSQLPHDIYHLPEYLALSAEYEKGTPLAFVAEGNDTLLFIPLLIRPIPSWDGLLDAATPYGYPGPLLKAGTESPVTSFVRHAVNAFVTGLKEQGVVAAFLRLHPFYPFPAELVGIGLTVTHGETVYVDLSLSPEEIWRQTRANHRSNINNAKRQGHLVEMDTEFREIDTFVDLYYQTMKRAGAREFYYFPKEYFYKLVRVSPGNLHLFTVRIDGEVASAGLFTEVCGIVQYHLSGTKDKFLCYHPLKTMLDHVRWWAKSRGNLILNLGSGLGGQRDSLFHFKQGFSHLTKPLSAWQMVVQPDLYTLLVREWERSTGFKTNDAYGFFPAYRRPITKREVHV